MGSYAGQSQASPPHSVIGKDKNSPSEIISQWKKSFHTSKSKSIGNLSSQLGTDSKKGKRDLAPLADTKRTKKQKMADKDMEESRSKNKRKTSSGYGEKVKVLYSGKRSLFRNCSSFNISIQFKNYSLNSFASLISLQV